LDDVKEGLSGIGIKGLTVSEVKGFGRQRGHKEVYRGAEYQVDFVSKVKIEVVMEAEMLPEAIKVIKEKALTGQIGDGKIFVFPVEEVIRIRTGETGKSGHMIGSWGSGIWYWVLDAVGYFSLRTLRLDRSGCEVLKCLPLKNLKNRETG